MTVIGAGCKLSANERLWPLYMKLAPSLSTLEGYAFVNGMVILTSLTDEVCFNMLHFTNSRMSHENNTFHVCVLCIQLIMWAWTYMNTDRIRYTCDTVQALHLCDLTT